MVFTFTRFFIVLMVYPATQTALVASTIGGDPKDMSIAVINDELPNWQEACLAELSDASCDVGHYSCRFLNRLESDHLNLVGKHTKISNCGESLSTVHKNTLNARPEGKCLGLFLTFCLGFLFPQDFFPDTRSCFGGNSHWKSLRAPYTSEQLHSEC